MTNDEAKIIRDTWQKWGDALRQQPKLESETRCIECGALMADEEFAEKLHPCRISLT